MTPIARSSMGPARGGAASTLRHVPCPEATVTDPATDPTTRLPAPTPLGRPGRTHPTPSCKPRPYLIPSFTRGRGLKPFPTCRSLPPPILLPPPNSLVALAHLCHPGPNYSPQLPHSLQYQPTHPATGPHLFHTTPTLSAPTRSPTHPPLVFSPFPHPPQHPPTPMYSTPFLTLSAPSYPPSHPPT